jgi:predicted amidohydrolase
VTFEHAFLRLLLGWRSRRGHARRLVRRAVRALPRPHGTVPVVGGFRVAAVQLAFEICGPERFVQKVAEKVNQAIRLGAELVVFPEDTGTMLLGMVPGMERLLAADTIDEALARVGRDVRVADVVMLTGGALRRVYETTFQDLAAKAGVFIAAGSLLVPTEDERVLNVGYLFGPQGLVGRQAKTHLLPLEVSWGLDAGDDLEVWDTPLGRLAMPICMDATYFETFRILALMGADVALLPMANPEPQYNPFKALRGLWPRVQEARLYGVASAMVGSAFGLTLTGKSGIYAPLALTARGDGIIAEAERPDEETVVVGDLDIAALQRYRAEHPLPYRTDVYRRYFPSIYHGHWRAGVRETHPRA